MPAVSEAAYACLLPLLPSQSGDSGVSRAFPAPPLRLTSPLRWHLSAAFALPEHFAQPRFARRHSLLDLHLAACLQATNLAVLLVQIDAKMFHGRSPFLAVSFPYRAVCHSRGTDSSHLAPIGSAPRRKLPATATPSTYSHRARRRLYPIGTYRALLSATPIANSPSAVANSRPLRPVFTHKKS